MSRWTSVPLQLNSLRPGDIWHGVPDISRSYRLFSWKVIGRTRKRANKRKRVRGPLRCSVYNADETYWRTVVWPLTKCRTLYSRRRWQGWSDAASGTINSMTQLRRSWPRRALRPSAHPSTRQSDNHTRHCCPLVYRSRFGRRRRDARAADCHTLRGLAEYGIYGRPM